MISVLEDQWMDCIIMLITECIAMLTGWSVVWALTTTAYDLLGTSLSSEVVATDDRSNSVMIAMTTLLAIVIIGFTTLAVVNVYCVMQCKKAK